MSVTALPHSRFPHAPPPPAGSARALSPMHPAVVEGRTLFPTTVVDPRDAPRLFVSGANQRKLGDRITKGPWAGMPIYALTLEERKTCPSSCHHWASCYGNAMHWSRRHRHGPELEAGLERELAAFQLQHPRGFAIRLHILGDFYSAEYVGRWAAWLDRFPALHVFGFTARPPGTAIGDAVAGLSAARWDRFAIRLSHTEAGRDRAVTLASADDRTEAGVICPAQTGDTASCGSCGFCWSDGGRDKTVFFLTHGIIRATGQRKRLVPTGTNSTAGPPALVESLQAELARLTAELRGDPSFRKYEAIARVLRLYRSAEDPEPGRAVRPRLVTRGPDDRAAILRRLEEGATNRDIAAEFRITPLQAQGYRIGNRRRLSRVAG